MIPIPSWITKKTAFAKLAKKTVLEILYRWAILTHFCIFTPKSLKSIVYKGNILYFTRPKNLDLHPFWSSSFLPAMDEIKRYMVKRHINKKCYLFTFWTEMVRKKSFSIKKPITLPSRGTTPAGGAFYDQFYIKKIFHNEN